MYFYTDSLVWITLAIVGIVFGILSVTDSAKDIAVSPDPASKRLSQVAVITETIRIIAQMAFLFVGLITIGTPNRATWTPAGTVLVVAEAMLVVNTIIMFRERRQIVATLAEELLERDTARDTARDAGRDPTRDEHRDVARDREHDAANRD